jgi:predicted XRE-type DNA-binding protein
VRQRLIEERKEEREKMPNGKPVSKPGHVTKGDIFDDLGLSPEESLEAKIKSDLWKDLVLHIEKRSLDQASLKKILKIHQPDVSNLLKGKISKFSTGKLIQFAVRLNLGVHVQLKEPKPARHVVSNLSAAKAEKKNRQMTRV